MNEPLVSIVVITYNSSKYVLETLESAKVQTYQNIELIVSDDCSTDNTVDICKSWIEENTGRFVKTELITTEKNTGIAQNCNRGCNAAKGEWIKLIAGDDLLLPDAIESYMSAVNEKISFILGNVLEFDKNAEMGIIKPVPEFISEDGETQALLNKKIFCNIRIAALLMRRSTFIELNGFDERFPMMEDMPFYDKIFQHKYKFYHVDKVVVKYRIHPGSVQRSPKFRQSHVNYVNQVLVPDYLKDKRYIDYWHDKLWSEKELAKIGNQSVKAFCIYLLMLISDFKEWSYVIRDKIYRPVIFKWRDLKK